MLKFFIVLLYYWHTIRNVHHRSHIDCPTRTKGTKEFIYISPQCSIIPYTSFSHDSASSYKVVENTTIDQYPICIANKPFLCLTFSPSISRALKQVAPEKNPNFTRILRGHFARHWIGMGILMFPLHTSSGNWLKKWNFIFNDFYYFWEFSGQL